MKLLTTQMGAKEQQHLVLLEYMEIKETQEQLGQQGQQEMGLKQ